MMALFLSMLLAQPAAAQEVPFEKLPDLQLNYGCAGFMSRDLVQLNVSTSRAERTIRATHAVGKSAASPLIRNAMITRVTLAQTPTSEDWIFFFEERSVPSTPGSVQIQVAKDGPTQALIEVGARRLNALICLKKAPTSGKRS